MRATRWAVSLLLLSAPLFGQSKIETAANFSVRAVDTVQTCYLMHTRPGLRERFLKTQSCAGVAGYNAGFAFGSWAGDRWLLRHGHGRLAHLQVVSAAGSGIGLVYTWTHTR